MSERKLTPKQERFCQNYTIHWNATRAAKEAGYSHKSAMELGYQLLQISSVKSRIKELSEHALNEAGITRERVLAEYGRIAFIDPSQAYDNLGQLLPIHEMPEDVRRAIHKIKILEQFDYAKEDKELVGFLKEVEFSPKKGALDSLSRYLGMAPDRVEHSGPGGNPIETINISKLPDEELDARIQKLIGKKSEIEPSETENDEEKSK